jgi:flagellar biosynthesis component FlhA
VSSLREVLPELIDEQSIRNTIEYLEPQFPDVVSSFLSSSTSYGQVAVICRELVSHGFTLKALPQILQVLVEQGSDKRASLELIDLVRLRIKRQLCFECIVSGGGIKAITLSVGFERALIKNISQNLFETGLQLIEFAAVVERLLKVQVTISAVVVNHSLRRAIADALLGRNCRIKVLSYDELVTGFNVDEIKRISHEDLISDTAAIAA